MYMYIQIEQIFEIRVHVHVYSDRANLSLTSFSNLNNQVAMKDVIPESTDKWEPEWVSLLFSIIIMCDTCTCECTCIFNAEELICLTSEVEFEGIPYGEMPVDDLVWYPSFLEGDTSSFPYT